MATAALPMMFERGNGARFGWAGATTEQKRVPPAGGALQARRAERGNEWSGRAQGLTLQNEAQGGVQNPERR